MPILNMGVGNLYLYFPLCLYSLFTCAYFADISILLDSDGHIKLTGECCNYTRTFCVHVLK